MATQAERRAARERVSAYHQSQLAELLSHLGAEVDRYRAGEIDACAADETIHRYHRAAAELWKFCFARGGGAHAEFVAGLLDRMTADAENHRLVGTRHTATTPMTTTVLFPRAGAGAVTDVATPHNGSARKAAVRRGLEPSGVHRSRRTEQVDLAGSNLSWAKIWL